MHAVSIIRIATCTVPSLRLLYSKQARGRLSHRVSTTVHSFFNASGIEHPALHGRITVIESISHRVVHPQRLLVLSRSVTLFASCSLLSSVAKKQTSRPHYPWVIPTILLFLERTISPLSGLNGCPSGSYFNSPPTTHAGPVACRPSPLAGRRRASLPCVRSRPSPPESRRGGAERPAASRPSLTLRASRPPSSGSSSFFFLVYGCFFRCVISSFVVPCGCWLRCFRRMALRLRVELVPRLRVWMRVASVPV